MTERKIVKASDLKKNTKKTASKSKIDLSGIKKIIDDNPEAVKKIKEGVTDIITSKVIGNTTKKTESNDSLSKVMDIASTLFKK